MSDDGEWTSLVLHPVIGPGRIRMIPACPICKQLQADLVDHPGVAEIAKDCFGHRADCKYAGAKS